MFGKSLKKFFGTVLSAAMVVSAMPVFTIGAYVDGTETSAINYLSKTTVLYYQDYEDYTGGNGFCTAKVGSHNFSTNGLTDKAAASIGRDGKGVQINPTDRTVNDQYKYGTSVGFDLTNPIKDGKLYMAFDIRRKDDSEIAKMLTDEGGYWNTQNYICFNHGKTDNTFRFYPLYVNLYHSSSDKGGIYTGASGVNGYSSTNKLSTLDEGETHKVEMVVDVKTSKAYYYIDGVKTETVLELNSGNVSNPVDGSAGFAIYCITMGIGAGTEYLDNLTIAYIDDNSETPETFSITSENAFTGDNTLTVKATADITDNKAEPTTAPYGVSLSSDTLAKDNFTVKKDGETVNVKSVAKGEKTGEYIIETEENLTAGTYTVEVNNVTDVTGCLTLNDDAKTATVKVKDKVFVDEDFTGGMAELKNKASGSGEWWNIKFDQIGQMNFSTDKLTDTTLNGNNGLTVASDMRANDLLNVEFAEKQSDCVFSYSFDINRRERGENDTSVQLNRQVYDSEQKKFVKNEWSGDYKSNNITYLLYADPKRNATNDNGTKEDMDIIYGPAGGLGGWGDENNVNNRVKFEKNTTYNINQVLDLKNMKCYTYVDGNPLVEREITHFSEIEKFAIYFGGSAAYFDNLRIQYMSEYGETFKTELANKVLEKDATEMTINFEDPVAKDVINADNFEVKAADGTAVNVTAAEWVSPYEAKVKFNALESGNYTVSTQNITTAVGATADDTAMSFRVKTDGLYVDSFNEDTGTYTVNLKNDADEAKGAVLVAGVFVGGKLIECVTDDTFEEDAETLDGGADGSLSVTLTHANDAGAVVKVFLWDSLANAKPLAETLN